jgi:hypothetical protein
MQRAARGPHGQEGGPGRWVGAALAQLTGPSWQRLLGHPAPVALLVAGGGFTPERECEGKGEGKAVCTYDVTRKKRRCANSAA